MLEPQPEYTTMATLSFLTQRTPTTPALDQLSNDFADIRQQMETEKNLANTNFNQTNAKLEQEFPLPDNESLRSGFRKAHRAYLDALDNLSANYKERCSVVDATCCSLLLLDTTRKLSGDNEPSSLIEDTVEIYNNQMQQLKKDGQTLESQAQECKERLSIWLSEDTNID